MSRRLARSDAALAKSGAFAGGLADVGNGEMRAFFLALIAAGALAALGAVWLNSLQRPAETAFATGSVRVPESGQLPSHRS